MGREVFIYQLQEDKIAEGFYDFLRSSDIVNVFKDFIAERKRGFANPYDLTFEKLMEKVKEGLKEVDGDELFEIIYFMTEEISQELEGDADEFLRNLGLDKIYESKTKSEANLFISQYHNYIEGVMDGVDKDPLPNRDQVSREVFTGFLDYMLLYLNEVNKWEASAVSVSYAALEQQQLDEIRKRTASAPRIHQLMDQELELAREELAIHQGKETSGHLGHARSLFTRCVEIKSKLHDQVERLVVIDSV